MNSALTEVLTAVCWDVIYSYSTLHTRNVANRHSASKHAFGYCHLSLLGSTHFSAVWLFP